ARLARRASRSGPAWHTQRRNVRFATLPARWGRSRRGELPRADRPCRSVLPGLPAAVRAVALPRLFRPAGARLPSEAQRRGRAARAEDRERRRRADGDPLPRRALELPGAARRGPPDRPRPGRGPRSRAGEPGAAALPEHTPPRGLLA